MHDICHSYVNVSIYITEFAVNISDLWFMTTKKSFTSLQLRLGED